MVPPAETTTSAPATRLGPSTTRRRDDQRWQRERPQPRRLLPCARERDRMHVGIVAEPIDDRGEEVVAARVVEGELGRSSDHRDEPRPVRAERGKRVRVGLEVGEVVLLLESRVATELSRHSRRSAGVARAGSRRAPARAGTTDSRPCAAGTPTRSRTCRPRGCRARARRPAGRSSRVRHPRRSRGRARTGRPRASATRARAPGLRGPPRRDGRAPWRRDRGARRARSSGRSRAPSPTRRVPPPAVAARSAPARAREASW